MVGCWGWMTIIIKCDSWFVNTIGMKYILIIKNKFYYYFTSLLNWIRNIYILILYVFYNYFIIRILTGVLALDILLLNIIIF